MKKRENVPGHYPVKDGKDMMCIYRWMEEKDVALVQWLPMEEVTKTLTFSAFWYDNDRVLFVDADGREYSFFHSQLDEMIRHMVNGVITGRFKMGKKGNMYGYLFVGV